MARVEKMLSQVTAKHPFLQDPPLFQLLFRWARLHECTKEGDELAVFFRHCATKWKKTLHLRFDKAKHDTLRTVVTLPPTIDRNRFSKVRY